MKNRTTKKSPRTRLGTGIAVLACATIIGLWLGQYFAILPAPARPVIEDRPKVRDFSLTNTESQQVSLATYRGKWLLMFFGFTMCPEACPLAMQTVSATLQDMGEVGKTVQPIFITIDPERDTPAVLRDYLANFSDNIVGLSGSADETAGIAKLYGVYYRKRPLGDDYTMDHSTALYLVAPDGAYMRPFRADLDASELAADIATEIQAWKK